MVNLRVITGSYEHNLLCVALSISEKGEVFSPIFHFTPHTQSIRALAWSKRTLVSGSNDELMRLYDLQTRKEVGTLMHHAGQILCLEFFKAKWLLSGAGDGKICLWRSKDWELLAELKGHTAPVLDISVHSSGRIALSVGVDHKLVLWNLMTAKKASVRKLKNAPLQVEFVPDTPANYIIAFSKQICYYGSNGKTLKEWDVDSPVHRLSWYEKFFVVSTDDGKISFFNTEKDEPEFVLRGHATRVKDFSILNNFMASVSTDGNIVVWDLEKRDQVAVYNAGDRLNCVVLVPDEIEKIIKRPEPDHDADQGSDFSEVDEPVAVEQPKKKKKKSSKVIITR